MCIVCYKELDYHVNTFSQKKKKKKIIMWMYS